MFTFFTVLTTSFCSAQFIIHGQITDERGVGLPGANVLVINTNFGASSDKDGNYKIELHSKVEKFKVTAQYIGYKSETQLVKQLDGIVAINFELSRDILEMEATIVTGTADPKQKKKLGNSISTVRGAALKNDAMHIDAALSGKVAGAMVQVNSGMPGGGTTVRLRGASSISRNADPLYIIDGIVLDNSSTQLVDLGGYRTNRIADLDPDDIEHVEVIKGAAAAAIYGSRANDGIIQIFTKRGKTGKMDIQFKQTFGMDVLYKSLQFSELPYRGGGTLVDPVTEWTFYNQNDLADVTRYDWHDKIFQTGATKKTSISLSGGDNTTRYYLSGSNLNQTGIMRGTDYKKQNVRFNIEKYITDWLSFSASSNYIHSYNNLKPNGGLVGFYGVLTNLIFGPNIINYEADPNSGEYPNSSNYGIYTANPLDVIRNWKAPQELDRFIGGAKLTFKPLANLTMNLNYGYDTYTNIAKEYTPKNSSATQRKDGYSKSAVKTSKLFNMDYDASYEFDITADVNSITTAGINYQYDHSNIVTSVAENLAMLVELVQGETQYASEYVNKRKTLGYYLQETLGWKEKAFLTGSLRVDGSSTFGKDVRWQLFPKFSGSYIINDDYKIRSAYGFSGGQPVDSYSQFSNYNFESYSGGVGLVNATNGGNPYLKPERQEEFEFGADMTFFNDRVGVEATYYTSKVNDLILPKNVARSTGYTSQLANVGVLSNKGIELLLRTVNISKSILLWETTFTFSKNVPLIESLSDGGAFALPFSWGIVWVDEGQVPGYFWGYTSEGIDPETGIQIRSTEKAIIGNPNPDLVCSFTNDIKIGANLVISVQFDAVLGQDVFNFTERMLQTPYFASGTAYDEEILGEVPVGFYNMRRRIYENYIEDGSFIKLRNLNVNYSLDLPIIQRMGIKEVVLSLTGRNLLTFTKYTGMDPEVHVAAQSTLVRGFDFATIPIPTSWNFSILLNF